MHTLAEAEHAMLRSELTHLKDCQFKFLTFAIGSAAGLLSVAEALKQKLFFGGAFVLPLVIVLPAWWVFFDKATTFTRIVGYYRFLELEILRPGTLNYMRGWETALGEFRRMQQAGMFPPLPRMGFWSSVVRVIRLATLNTTQRYWVLAYMTFCGLSVICLGLQAWSARGFWLWGTGSLSAILVAVSALVNASLVTKLVWGEYSVDCNEQRWRSILLRPPTRKAH